MAFLVYRQSFLATLQSTVGAIVTLLTLRVDLDLSCSALLFFHFSSVCSREYCHYDASRRPYLSVNSSVGRTAEA